jgi:hypothetical protein
VFQGMYIHEQMNHALEGVRKWNLRPAEFRSQNRIPSGLDFFEMSGTEFVPYSAVRFGD